MPEPFARWFVSRGWLPRAHQLDLLAKVQAGASVLLIAPTGGGKTLAGFLPSLVELSAVASRERRPSALASPGGEAAPQRQLYSIGRDVRRERGLHTLYISPLKALAVDIARNLEAPIAEMGLPIRIETRTGDTPASKRQRQRRDPPDMLLTTPEQLAPARVRRRALPARGAQARYSRRTACTGHVEALRTALARACPLIPACAFADQHRPLGDSRRTRRPAPLHGAAA